MVVGIDEVGRGCWAGPLVAGAVMLSKPIAGLADSKVLTVKRRQQLAVQIQEKAKDYGLGWVEPAEVDALGLTASVRLAMQRALGQIKLPANEIIIARNFNFLHEVSGSKAIIKADGLVPAVSAASIIAKVARDEYMVAAAKDYPAYGFERHVGYGTSLHRAALCEHGPCKIHRMSYKPIQALLH